MKVIDRTPAPAKDDEIIATVSKFRKAAEGALNIKTDETAQETFIAQMGKLLPGKYTLLKNVPIDGLDVPVPLILIGPAGIFSILASAKKGVFRAKNEYLAEMNRTRQFEPSKPNLLHRAVLFGKALEEYLKRLELEIPEVGVILYFSDPGTHVDSVRPAARILLADGLERFASSLLQAEPVYSSQDTSILVTAFTDPFALKREGDPDFVEPVEEEETLPEPEAEPVVGKKLDALSRRIPLTRKQWIVVGLMALVEALVLVGLIFLILTTG